MPQYIDSFRVPDDYEVWRTGVYQLKKGDWIVDHLAKLPEEPDVGASFCPERIRALTKVSVSPIWFGRTGKPLGSDVLLLELLYHDGITQGARNMWVTRGQISARGPLIQLADKGIPVTENTWQKLIDYLEAAYVANAPLLESAVMASRVGFHETPVGLGCMLGGWIGPGDVEPDARVPAFREKLYGVSGDEEVWFEKFYEVMETYGGEQTRPIMRWLLHTTYCAPLLRFLGQRSFIVHHHGSSGKGKSSLAKFCQSAWGDPHKLMETWNSTAQAFTERFSHISDVPVLFDELQAATVAQAGQIVYALTLERGRARVKTHGGLEDQVESWHSMIRSTGEVPLVGMGGGVDQGGQSNRVMQINEELLTERQAQLIYAWLAERHFGWGGYRFVEYLTDVVNDRDQYEMLNLRFATLREKLAEQLIEYQLDFGRIEALSVTAMAEYLGMRWFRGFEHDDALTLAVDDAIFVAKTMARAEAKEDVVDRALAILRDHYYENRGNWFKLEDFDESGIIGNDKQKLRTRPMMGIVASEEIWLIPSAADKLLMDKGMTPKRIWQDLRKRGDLHETFGLACYSIWRSHGGFNSRVYAVRREAILTPIEEVAA